MNSLKNLVIIAVLAAVGYGVYVSLSRNNVDSQQSSTADGWPAVPKVEMPGQKSPSLGGPLPLSADPPKLADSNTPPPAPPLVSASPSSPTAGSMLPPSSLSPPSAPPLTALPSSPSATLGPPTPSDISSGSGSPNPIASSAIAPPGMNPVRNIAPPPAASNNANADKPTNPADILVQSKYAAFMQEVQKTLDQGKFAEAQLALSKLYNNPDLPSDLSKQITTLLDQLAGTVIYSRQHYLEPAYVTQHGDTFDKLAREFQVPWQLLARINGMMPPGVSAASDATKDQPLPVGRVLKMVRGPFDAVIHLDRRELTLMVQNRYAGRFPIGVGRDLPKLEGEYTVHTKTLSPVYYGPDNVTIPANDPKNPLGGAWIGLTDRIGIHGTNDPQSIGRDDNRGAISTGDRDLQDLYGILTVGSRVTILR